MTIETPGFPGTVAAATVVVFRNGPAGEPPELLMLERAGSMKFAGGAAVFPGGKVDTADRELAAKLSQGFGPDDAASRVAALRETIEEAGLVLGMQVPVTADQAAEARAMLIEHRALSVVLDHFGWVPDLGIFNRWARWCPRREGTFDTRFYLADLGTGAVNVSKDNTENSHMFWASANEVLAMAERGEISVIFPTRRNLERLALHNSFAEARNFAALYPDEIISASIRDIDGTDYLTIRDDMGYPVTAQLMSTVRRS